MYIVLLEKIYKFVTKFCWLGTWLRVKCPIWDLSGIQRWKREEDAISKEVRAVVGWKDLVNGHDKTPDGIREDHPRASSSRVKFTVEIFPFFLLLFPPLFFFNPNRVSSGFQVNKFYLFYFGFLLASGSLSYGFGTGIFIPPSVGFLQNCLQDRKLRAGYQCNDVTPERL